MNYLNVCTKIEETLHAGKTECEVQFVGISEEKFRKNIEPRVREYFTQQYPQVIFYNWVYYWRSYVIIGFRVEGE